MPGYRELKVWRLAMELAEDVYKLCAEFPKHEVYGLTSQLQRAAVSIPSNIAEWSGAQFTQGVRSFCWHCTGFFG